MKLTFLGATENVSGSQYLLAHKQLYVLIDCGIDYQNPHQTFEFNVSQINYVLLTHAHTDHAGKLIQLFQQGFKGKILATAPTISLCRTLLQESLHILNPRLSVSEQKKSIYNYMQFFEAIPTEQTIAIEDTLQIDFIPSGHIIGAVSIRVTWQNNNQTSSICFSGDIGRSNDTLHSQSTIYQPIDYLICEATYGDRNHPEKDALEFLETEIKHTCIEKKGKLIIPAFGIGRTQQILYALHKIYIKNKIYDLPVVIDSNSAYQSSRVYEKECLWLHPEAQVFKKTHQQITQFDAIIYLKTNFQFNKIQNFNRPCIILTSSGMMVGGRVLKHLSLHLQHAANTLLMVGYAAPHTLAYQLLNDKSSVEINQQKNKIKADIHSTDVFSAHADQSELLQFIQKVDGPRLKKIFLTHGNNEAKIHLMKKIKTQSSAEVHLPQYGETIEL